MMYILPEIQAQGATSDYREYAVVCSGRVDYSHACIYLGTDGDPEVLAESFSDSGRVYIDRSKVTNEAMFLVLGYRVEHGVKTLVGRLHLPASDLRLSDSIRFLQLKLLN